MAGMKAEVSEQERTGQKIKGRNRAGKNRVYCFLISQPSCNYIHDLDWTKLKCQNDYSPLFRSTTTLVTTVYMYIFTVTSEMRGELKYISK